ncbi:MAG TPA: dihydropyrimidinase [Vicinamibacteria bacterium]|nr:dihydropyrimidinase [Vicinamibacteria bacterium]
MELDLVVRNGNVVTATEEVFCDIGIAGGRIAAIARKLDSGRREIDAEGHYVFPGGIDGHCHIEQLSSSGLRCADDFYTGTVSAAFGGTTTVVSFAAQHRGDSLKRVVSDYHARAKAKAVVDYAFHLILSDPTETALREELPELIRNGYPSVKVYTTYDRLRLDDYQILEVLSLARREGALTMVHAENHDMIRWLTERLLYRGARVPGYHAVAHPRLAESEAASRTIALAELVDAPILIVHVSSQEALAAIRRAQERGLKVYAETCPQYLFLTAEDLGGEGMEGARFCCSPPPRDEKDQEAMWRGLSDGTFQILSSDHAPYRFDETEKGANDSVARFDEIASGLPGLEVRMPLLFSEGVRGGRIDIHRFVELTSTRAAKLYGMFPQKGSISIGADADLVIWDAERELVIESAKLHDNAGYTPYEGRRVTGWPITVLSRGRVVVEDNTLQVERGSGAFVAREKPAAADPTGRPVPERQLARRLGTSEAW